MERIRDDTAIWDFATQFLVECPKCSRCASVEPSAAGSRLVCKHCAHTASWVRRSSAVSYSQHASAYREGEISICAAVDWFFHLPLWLQTPCVGHVLWAYNRQHLEFEVVRGCESQGTLPRPCLRQQSGRERVGFRSGSSWPRIARLCWRDQVSWSGGLSRLPEQAAALDGRGLLLGRVTSSLRDPW